MAIKKESILVKRYVIIALLALGCVLFFGFNLDDLNLLKGDENYYFSSARRMIREGDWITPRYHHHIRFEKPALYYWVVAVFFKLFGVSWSVARMTSVISGMLTVLLTYLFGLRFFTKKIALLSSVILATTFLFFQYARLAVIDITFLFLITLSLYLFVKGDREKRRGCFILSFVSLGFSIIAKGPLGLVIVVLTVGSYIIMSKRYALLKEINLPLGILIVLLIGLPWPLIMYKIHGHEYLNHLWEVEAVGKTIGSLLKPQDVSAMPWSLIKYLGYYIPVVIFTFAPWGLFLPFAFFRKFNTTRNEDRNFILCWFWSVFLFFSIVSFKHTHYMLLLSPPLAMIAANFFSTDRSTPFLRKAPIVIAVATVAAYITLIGLILPALDDGALKSLTSTLASEIKEQDEEVGIASKSFNLKKVGIHLNNLVSTSQELGGDDLAQYRRVRKDNVADFFKSTSRVFCLITKKDYNAFVPRVVRDRLIILGRSEMWKRFRFKEVFPSIFKMDWDDLKEEVYLISNEE